LKLGRGKENFYVGPSIIHSGPHNFSPQNGDKRGEKMLKSAV